MLSSKLNTHNLNLRREAKAEHWTHWHGWHQQLTLERAHKEEVKAERSATCQAQGEAAKPGKKSRFLQCVGNQVKKVFQEALMSVPHRANEAETEN